ncbi:jun-like transcription factor [Batrachochytrium dendrobatidis]|nr:jun-like transcription factor [Batrachochytrium dendrobatidis]
MAGFILKKTATNGSSKKSTTASASKKSVSNHSVSAKKKTVTSSSSSSSSSSSDSSDSSDSDVPTKAKSDSSSNSSKSKSKSLKKSKSKKSSSSTKCTTSSSSETVEKEAISTSTPISGLKRKAEKANTPPSTSSGKRYKVDAIQQRFQRVRAEEVEFADEKLKDNRFVSKGGADGDYGYKAHMDLIVTRGKGFTKEKNKKKRGSYRGGVINSNAVHSIKFDNSD